MQDIMILISRVMSKNQTNNIGILNCKKLYGDEVPLVIPWDTYRSKDMKFQEAFGDGKLEVSKFEVVVKDSKKLVADSETVLEHYKQKYL